MKTQLNQGLHEVIDLLLDDGVLLAPTDMGYVLAACTNKAIHTIYDIKRRPVSKPSGIVVSPELLKKYSIGKSKNIGKLLPHPMGIIDYYDPQNAILNCATSRIKSNGKVAFFIYLNELLTDLAEKSYEAGYPLMATSANLAGMGNVYNLDNMPQEILERAQLVQGGDTSLYQTRSDFENITNTIMDVATGELVRSGVFVNQILHHLNGMGILKDPASKVIDIENEIPRSFWTCWCWTYKIVARFL